MSDETNSIIVDALPEQITKMAAKIQSAVGNKPDNFDDLAKEYLNILVDIAKNIGLDETNISDTNTIESIQKITDQIVDKLKSDKNIKLSNDYLNILLVFFTKYEAGIIKPTNNIIENIGENIGENTGGMRRRTRKNKRRITKNKNNGKKNNNKRKTKKH